MPIFQIGGQTKRSKFTPKSVEIDFEKLPQGSTEFLLAYGLKQYLADGAAGAQSQSEFDEGIAARLDNVKKASFARARVERGPSDDTETLAASLAKQEIRRRAKAKKVELSKDRVDELAKQARESKSTFWHGCLEEASRQIAARAKLAEGIGESLEESFAENAAEALGIA